MHATPTRIRRLLGLGLFVFAAVWGNAAGVFAAEAAPDTAGTSKTAQKPLNVLFIAVDDLRPELGCYGHPQVKSPHIDALAATGLRFDRAYCQQAVCNPSRASLLTGLRPENTGVLDLPTHFRDKVPDAVSLPQMFKEQGYLTARFGKIYHTGHGNRDDEKGWSEPGPAKPKAKPKAKEQAGAAGDAGRFLARQAPRPAAEKKNVPAFEATDGDDSSTADGKVAAQAIAALASLKDRGKPFFLAVGFVRPHLPFVAPKKYWDLYRPEDVRPAANPFHPKDAPAWTGNGSGELRTYQGIPQQGAIPDDLARKLVHGYWASVSHMDAQVGRVLAALDAHGLRENTVIVLWGDHGWQLGEHASWCKHTNYETSTRAPLIVSVPGQKSAGKASAALVEFVDVYPTLAELCGRTPPTNLEGTSLVPLLDDPGRPWKSAAFSVYPRGPKEHGKLLGYTVRTDKHRYVEWRKVAGGEVVQRELYDHTTDPAENANLAGDPARGEDVARLAAVLKAGWKGALPPTGK